MSRIVGDVDDVVSFFRRAEKKSMDLRETVEPVRSFEQVSLRGLDLISTRPGAIQDTSSISRDLACYPQCNRGFLLSKCFEANIISPIVVWF